MKSECAEGGPDAKYAAQKGLALTERAAVSVSLLRGDSARAPGERTFLKLASTTRKEDAGAGDPHLPSYRVEQPAWEFNLQSDGPEDSQRMQRDLLISPHRPARSALSEPHGEVQVECKHPPDWQMLAEDSMYQLPW